MKISELEDMLQKIRLDNGDLEVVVSQSKDHSKVPTSPIIEEPKIGVSHERINLPDHLRKEKGKREWRKYLDPESQRGQPIVRIKITKR